MKIKTFILTFLLMSCPFLFGQNHWAPIKNTSSENMNAFVKVNIAGENQTANVEVGAFIDNVCYGSAILEDGYAFLTICKPGSVTSNTITFKLYSNDTEYILNETLNYAANNTPDIENPTVLETAAVAKTNGLIYETLADAVAAAADGETVTLLRNETGAGLKINKNVAIDFGGNTYTINSPVGSLGHESQGFQLLKGNNVTIKNGTVDVVPGTHVVWMFNAYANLTLENVTVNCENMVRADDSRVLVVNNGGGATPAVTYTNVTIKDFPAANAPIFLDTNTTLTGPEGLDIETENGYVYVYTYGVYTSQSAVAAIGDTKYASLSEAIKKATAGQTITLLADVNENVTVNKSLTIDGAEKNYTGTMKGNSNLTITVQNVNFINGGFAKETKDSKGTYTFLNCTFDGNNNTYAYPLLFKGAKTIKVENCTVKDYLYSFLYVTSSTTDVNVNNVTVENCPNYAIYFASGITNATIEKLTVNKSNNGIIYNNTANRALILKDCTFENVNTAINHNGGTNTITCNFQGVNEIGTSAFSQYVKIVAAAQVGTKIYDEFATAYAAVPANGTIKLYNDAEIAETLNVPHSLTIDGNSKTLKYTGSSRAIDVKSETNGADFTVKDLTVNCTSSYCPRGINYNTNGTLTLDGVTVKGTNVTYALNLPGSSDDATVVINNSSLTANIALNVWGERTNITAKNSEFHSVDNSTTEGYAAIAFNNDNETHCAGTNIVINGGKIIAKDENGEPSTAVRNSAVVNFEEGVNYSYENETEIVGAITTPVALVKYTNTTDFYSCTTLQAAIDRAKNDANATVLLIANETSDKVIEIKGNVVIDLNDKTVEGTFNRLFRITEEAVVTISNGTIKNNVSDGRCIETRTGNVTLNLNEVELIAENGASQPLTVGGSGNNIEVNATSSTISAGTGYGITTFNPVVMKLDATEVSGYGALNIKLASSSVGSAGSVFNIENGSELIGTNNAAEGETNSFSVVMVEDKNITINVENSTLKAVAKNNPQAIFGLGNEYVTEAITGLDINVNANSILALDGAKEASILGLQENQVLGDNSITVPATYAERLRSEGWVVSEATNDLVTVLGTPVAAIGDTKYASLSEAIKKATAGQTITLLADVNENVTVNKSLTIDGAEKNYTGTMKGNSNLTITVQNVNFINGGFAKETKDSKGTYTFLNCTFDGNNNTYAYPLLFKGAKTIKVENCTVKDYLYSFLYVTSSTTDVNVNNVTVENCPNYAIYFASGITNATIEKLTVNKSNNGIIYNNTANRALILKDCTFENVNTAINHNGGTNTITCNFQGVNEIGTSVFSEYVKIVADAQIGTKIYGELQDAINACTEGETTITLLADNAKDVTVAQAPNVKITIDGAQKNYTGTITVDGKSEAYATAALTIKNVNFDASNISKDASINLGGTNSIRYTSNVTVDNCNFTGTDNAKVGIKNYTGGCKNLTVTNTTAKGLHSLVQVKGVAGITVDNVTITECKNGIAAGPSTNVVIKNSNITATGYGVRADGSVVATMEVNDNNINAKLPVVVRNTNAAYYLVASGNTFTASNDNNDITFTTGNDEAEFVVPTANATATITGTATTFGFDARIENVYYTTFDNAKEAATAAATANQTITVINPIVIKETKEYDLTGITVKGDVYPMFRIQNGATATFNGGNFENGDYVFTLGEGASAEDTFGNLVINGGKYHGETTVANVVKGNLTINGGEFSAEPAPAEYTGDYRYLINCYDASYSANLATVAIYGGTFHNWNPEDNKAEVEHTNFCADGFGSLNAAENVWMVKPVQTIELKKDWNWVSQYVIGTDYETVFDQLQTKIGANGIEIKAQVGMLRYEDGEWNGSLESTTPSEMYKINVNADKTIKIVGDIVNPEDYDITLAYNANNAYNWNYIGLPMDRTISVADAFASVVKSKDIVKSQDQFAQYFNGQWWGSLKNLEPGVGYMYERKDAEATFKFTYPTQTRGAVEANITTENNHWVPAGQYANNMSMVATLGANSENYELAAFVNGEVRGSARPIYVDVLDTYMFFLTINGNDIEEVTFKCYDINTNTEYTLGERINYSNNAILGSVEEPVVLRGTLGMGEVSANAVAIYPNPATTSNDINLATTCDKVEVFNALGVKVAEYQNVDTIDALETAGVYVIRVTNNGNTQNCRLVVK